MASALVKGAIGALRRAQATVGRSHTDFALDVRESSYRLILHTRGHPPDVRREALTDAVIESFQAVALAATQAGDHINAQIAAEIEHLVELSLGPRWSLSGWRSSLWSPQGVPPTPEWSLTDRTQAAIRHTLGLIHAVHHVPQDLPPLRFTNDVAGADQGAFSRERVLVAVSPGAEAPELTACHEIGHYFDFTLLPGDDEFATSLGHPAMDQWRAAVNTSLSMKALNELASQRGDDLMRERIAYLRLPAEVFARSYAQWVALRSNGPTLLEQIARRRSTHDYRAHTQWADDDFASIAAALDVLMLGQATTTGART